MPTRCVSCNSDHEDLNHIFFECSFAIQVWLSAGIWYEVQNAVVQSNSAVEAIFYLLQHLSTTHQQRFSALCWSLWKHRNLKVWENTNEVSVVVVDRAWTLIADWENVNYTPSNTLLHMHR